MPGIVVGVDGSMHARAALDWAMREAATRHDALTVLTVSPAEASPWTHRPLTMPAQGAVVTEARQAVEKAVSEVAGEIGPARPESVTVKAFSGFPARALIDASRVADLIVIGSRGAGGFETLLMGSISSQVVHHAACPVVVVPTGR
jgi:nucleotide-binding universal stress UspA family protein